MALEPGTRLGQYEIVAPLGAGGMGEVYRARDNKLGRDVATKVLPAGLARNADALARFEREARAVAALSHPNILSIHDFGTQDGIAYAVMELLEGETLGDRLAAGPLPPRKVIELARQAARGLGAAHEKGIVHRDLKPENLFVTRDGRIKILDFGLARLDEGGDGKAEPAETPTRTSLTSPGTVMGTVSYMSPEQVRGETAEAGSDIFAFGSILFEMLTGQRAFARETPAETMTAILREDVSEPSESGRQIPPLLDRIVRRCLEKQPGERFRSAVDLAFALESAAGTSSTGVQAAVDAPSARRFSPALVGVALAAMVVGILTGVWFGSRGGFPPTAEPVRIRPLTFSGSDRSPTTSPDGRMLAFSSARDGTSRIWIKQIASGDEAVLTEGPDVLPRFSPDGSAILFVRQEATIQSLYHVPVVGGAPRKLIHDAMSGDWSPDGKQIVFVRGRSRDATAAFDLGLTSVDGGSERILTEFTQLIPSWPRWSPDGRWIAVTRRRATNNVDDSVVLIDAQSGEIREIAGGGSYCGSAWTRDNLLVYGHSDDLLAGIASSSSEILLHDIDKDSTRQLLWAEHLFAGTALGVANLEVLAPGELVFNNLALRQNLREIPFPGRVSEDRGLFATLGSARDRQPVYSPDGKTVLFSSNRSGNLDLWKLSLESGAVSRLTDDPAGDWDPAFTADGSQILWSSDRGGNLEIWIADADGSRARQVSNDGLNAENPTSTPDGSWIVYASGNPERAGVWKIRPDGSEATLLAAGSYYVPEMSPDGRFVVFNEANVNALGFDMRFIEVATGQPADFEISFPVNRLLAGAGSLGRARWTPDGKGIVFLAPDEHYLGLYYQEFAPGRDTTSTRRPLAGFEPSLVPESFGISPDGKRLLVSHLEQSWSVMIAEGVPGIGGGETSR